ncbi:hypothetical protein [Krasilnikovia sp. M28-CT-15]|uniref:hypothetical protein n=1 Tax=Krasilnikovia sp. M28-CT-15 TaxID=3373540 RepID=UPI003875DBA7
MTRWAGVIRRLVTIVEFPSYEAAMANSELPETGEFARQMAALCSNGPEFQNLEVKRTFPA